MQEEFKEKLSVLKRQQYDLRQQAIDLIRQAEAHKFWKPYKSLNEFCHKAMGYKPEQTRDLLLEAGLILTAETMRADDPAVQRRIDGLLQWRREKASQLGVPAYRILTNHSLLSLASTNPQKLIDLFRIRGLGEKKMIAFGEELLEALRSF